jgi:PAS domain S-box-containing protein
MAVRRAHKTSKKGKARSPKAHSPSRTTPAKARQSRPPQSPTESEAKFRRLAETAPAAIYIFQGTRFLYVNPATEAITGYSRPELLSMEVWDVVHPDFRALTRQRGLARQQGKQVPSRYEFKIITQSGEERWLDFAGTTIDFGGKLAVMGIAHDITERKRAEEALRASEERYRDLIENVRDAMYTLSPDGTITSLNSAFEEITGWPRTEWIGKNFAPILHPDDLPVALELFHRTLQGETPPAFELRVLTKSGGYVVGEFKGTPLIHKGQVVGVLGIARDISERKQAEAALRQSEERFSKAFHASPVAISITTLEGCFLDVNDSFLALMKYSREEVIGHTSLELRLWANPEDRVRLGKILLEQRRVRDVESQFRTRTGEIREALASAELIDFSGQPCVLTLIHDITERKRAEEALRQAYDDTLEGWVRALDLRDKEIEGHTQRVTEMTVRLARQLGVAESDLLHIRRGALLHDIGKIAISDTILLKNSSLSEEERQMLYKHPLYAYEMLSAIDYLRPALDIPYCHHERWDGRGYPHGLKGKQIPLAARIFAVVDAYDAMTSDRPYRRALSRHEALTELQRQSGEQFDPQVVEAFMQMLELPNKGPERR